MEEIWKDILGYEGLYQISNLGRVRRLPSMIKSRWGGLVYKKMHYITGGLESRGYRLVLLYKDGIRTSVKVHRLVAQAFIPNPNKLPMINHKNGIKNDNRVENLEWCDSFYNMKHSYYVLGNKHIGKLKYWKGKTEKNNKHSKIILQIKDGKIIAEFYGGGEIERKLNISAAHVRDCCLNKRKSSYGYQWKYKIVKPKQEEEQEA